jgi:hypothetical protein
VTLFQGTTSECTTTFDGFASKLSSGKPSRPVILLLLAKALKKKASPRGPDVDALSDLQIEATVVAPHPSERFVSPAAAQSLTLTIGKRFGVN